MGLETRHRTAEPTVYDAYSGGSGGGGPTDDARNVVVTYGIHRARYPVGGMTVAAAREVLGRLVHVDPDAVAVIDGTPVNEEETITENVSMLSFVKPSSIKG